MPITTRLTERLGVRHPIMLAPMDVTASGSGIIVAGDMARQPLLRDLDLERRDQPLDFVQPSWLPASGHAGSAQQKSGRAFADLALGPDAASHRAE